MINGQINPFLFVGNNLAIDFINTQYVSHGELQDLLLCPEDLNRWVQESAVASNLIEQNISIELVHEFRMAIKALILAHTEQRSLPTEALALLNQYLIKAPTQQKLVMQGEQLTLLPFYESLTLDQLLGKIANEAASVLTSSMHNKHIKHCSNSKCVLMFVDTSRSKKRRWCSMELCGNRAKASNFYHANKSV